MERYPYLVVLDGMVVCVEKLGGQSLIRRTHDLAEHKLSTPDEILLEQ